MWCVRVRGVVLRYEIYINSMRIVIESICYEINVETFEIENSVFHPMVQSLMCLWTLESSICVKFHESSFSIRIFLVQRVNRITLRKHLYKYWKGHAHNKRYTQQSRKCQSVCNRFIHRLIYCQSVGFRKVLQLQFKARKKKTKKHCTEWQLVVA